MRQSEPGDAGGPARVVAALACASIAAALAAAALALPPEAGGLTARVADALPASGIGQPVTAVLLNFRAYDTWFELGVLLLAVVALLALRRAPDLCDRPRLPFHSAVLSGASALVVPAMILTAGYLLWLGTRASGGAFQAGAVLGSAGVLLWLTGFASVAALPDRIFRAVLLAGFGAFLLAAVVLGASGRPLLAYPTGGAGLIIVLLEAAATLAIAATLAALFIGAAPRPPDPRPPTSDPNP